ncbi:MAG: hypothetical protein COB20_09485 [SAR86 cluster bacterium]|uniref:Uncharacterized protein n=1 Tax=SAR86 cluster bacterium TaxID=2030880 RepID=A0A2A4X4E7_9GAMM|nr:MAG: hypothetical protein COB20_09485 [SAR86 cluster bacterium]
MKPTFWFIPPLLISTTIFLLSTVLSVSFQIEGVSYTDKLSHTFAYFALTITLLLAFYKNEMLRTTNWLFLIIACSAYGVLLEFVQYGFFPNRYFEWLDALANVSGALIGGFTFRLFKKPINSKHRYY